VTILLVAHAGVTTALAGLVWFVQIVHYPLLQQVPDRAFTAYERRHVRRTGFVVAPLMLAELATAAALLVLAPEGARRWAVLGVVLLAVIWASTFGLQVPCHRRLETRRDPAVIDRLVRSNWIRTASWTARSAVAFVLLAGWEGMS
jgi:hypothetical protein